jgi:hypothetical protein
VFARAVEVAYWLATNKYSIWSKRDWGGVVVVVVLVLSLDL